jgi:hypothetical protein
MIENKVAQSGLITIDLVDWVSYLSPIEIDLAQWLYEGLILREKPFRDALKNVDWEQYRDCDVAVHCSTDAIIPSWAYLLVGSYLSEVEARYYHGDCAAVDRILTEKCIEQVDLTPYMDGRVILKGCSSLATPETAYLAAVKRLQPLVKSLMFGEACSTVPVYKRR